MMQVLKVTPLGDYLLRLEFSDGAVGDVDCSFLVGTGLGADLSDPSYFRRVRVDDEIHTIVWPNGLDPAPELLRARLTAVAAGSVAA